MRFLARLGGDEVMEEIVHYYGRMTPTEREHTKVMIGPLDPGDLVL